MAIITIDEKSHIKHIKIIEYPKLMSYFILEVIHILNISTIVNLYIKEIRKEKENNIV
jgi:hypothetical protein